MPEPSHEPSHEPSQDPYRALIAGRRQARARHAQTGRPAAAVQRQLRATTPQDRVIRVSITDDRAKTANLRRDPRASLPRHQRRTSGPTPSSRAPPSSPPVAADPHDATVDELVDAVPLGPGRAPKLDDYRAAMVRDGRVVLRLPVERVYGMVPNR